MQSIDKYNYESKIIKELKEKGYVLDVDNDEQIKRYQEKFRDQKVEINKKFWKERKVLITGIAGFVGSSLAYKLVELNAEVYGIVRRHAIPEYPNIQELVDKNKIIIYESDLVDSGHLDNIIREIQPEIVFHEAAESFVPTSINAPAYVTHNNCVSTVNVLEALRKFAQHLNGIYLACSSEEYGFVADINEIPVKETNELRPTSLYASTKVFTENVGKSYYYSYKLPTLPIRCFNQEGVFNVEKGPARGQRFFTSVVTRQVAKVLLGETDKIIIGNPYSIRDFSHIIDTVNAHLLSIEKANRGEPYNVCSGIGIKTGDFARLALKLYNLEDIPIMIDEKRLRPYERNLGIFDGFIGDNTKFAQKTGWKPTKSVIDIIKDSVEYWRKKV